MCGKTAGLSLLFVFRPLVVLRRVTQALMFVEGDPASEHSPKGSSGKEGALQKVTAGLRWLPIRVW